jgi:hypothetical protein
MTASAPPKVDEKLLLDWGTRIGIAARQDDLKASQLENLMAQLESVPGREALLVTAAFALRQAVRLNARVTGRVVSQALQEVYNGGGGKEEARRMLGFAKWVFEAQEYFRAGRVNVWTVRLEDFLRQAVGGR